MSDLEDVTLDYRVAFQRYLPRHSEAALTDGYELGRRAIVRGVSMLDLVHVHHAILAEVLLDTPGEDVAQVTAAAGDFLLEVLVIAVAGAFLLSRSLANGFAVVSASNGQIDGFHAFSNGSTTSITFQAARGLDLRDGPRLACQVVRPALASTDWSQAGWTIVNRAGDVIASDQTPCP